MTFMRWVMRWVVYIAILVIPGFLMAHFFSRALANPSVMIAAVFGCGLYGWVLGSNIESVFKWLKI